MEKEERRPVAGGIVDTKMYLLKYCFAKPALLLTEKEVQVYCQMMAAVGKAPYEIKPF
jgi:hypothetical protein